MRPDPRFYLIYAAPLLLAAMMMVSGCVSNVPDTARWTPSEAPKENKVDFVTMTHEVHFAPGATTVAPGEDRSLSAFLDQIELTYGDQVTLDAGPHGNNAPADDLAAKRVASVTAMLRQMRVHAQPAARPTVNGALDRDAIVVTVGRYVVTLPNCPDRSKPEADDYANVPPSNYSCATVTNLGLMVANPGDLVHGSPAGPADATYMARGVQRYRNGDISKSLEPELSKAGGGSSGGGGGN